MGKSLYWPFIVVFVYRNRLISVGEKIAFVTPGGQWPEMIFNGYRDSTISPRPSSIMLSFRSERDTAEQPVLAKAIMD